MTKPAPVPNKKQETQKRFDDLLEVLEPLEKAPAFFRESFGDKVMKEIGSLEFHEQRAIRCYYYKHRMEISVTTREMPDLECDNEFERTAKVCDLIQSGLENMAENLKVTVGEIKSYLRLQSFLSKFHEEIFEIREEFTSEIGFQLEMETQGYYFESDLLVRKT